MSQHLGKAFGHTEAGKSRGVVRFRQVLVRNGLARLPGDLGREIRERVGLVASELIGLAFVPCASEYRNRSLGKVR